jgi:hypothetical protein
MFDLALLYLEGRGVETNYETFSKLLADAEAAGDPRAKGWIDLKQNMVALTLDERWSERLQPARSRLADSRLGVVSRTAETCVRKRGRWTGP